MKLLKLLVILLLGLVSPWGPAAAEDEAGGTADKDAVYVKLSPVFVVNLSHAKRNRFMQIKAEAMVHGKDTAEAVKHHMPMVRHTLLMLFTEQSYAGMKTLQGKKKLQSDALKQVQTAFKEETGKKTVQAILFTSLVIQ